MKMYLVVGLAKTLKEFNISLHATRAAAEAAFEEHCRRFPRERWFEDFSNDGEGVQLYEVECDGGPAEAIEWPQRRPSPTETNTHER